MVKLVTVGIAAAVVLVGGFLLITCDPPAPASAGGVELAQAKGVIDAPEGATVTVTAEAPTPPLPDARVVRLAIERTVPWKHVNQVLERLDAARKQTVVLVGKRRKVRGFELRERLKVGPKRAFRLIATRKGRSCIAPAGSTTMSCVQRIDKKHIDRAFTREIVRKARGAYGVDDVIVEADADLEWADLVRAVDAARTCCKEPVRVSVMRGVRDESATTIDAPAE